MLFEIGYLKDLILYLINKEDKKMIKLLRLAIKNHNSEIMEDIKNFVDISEKELKKICIKLRAELERKEIGFITCFDDAYPWLLKEINDFPLGLFYRGNISILSKKCVSIVGSRKTTFDGKKACDQTVKHLKESGVNVVSGLAIGVDSLVHKASLHYGISAISVLPGSVDNPVPKTNLYISNAILEAGGLLLSERASGYKIEKSSYLERNRIISGLSDRILIIEAAIKSGSMSTAKFALEQNRDIYALPGSISNPVAQGCNYLIHKGANCLYSPEVFFDYELEGVKKEKNVEDILPQDEIIKYIYKEGRVDIDTLIGIFDIPKAEILSRLLEYEISGVLIRNGNFIEMMQAQSHLI